MWIMYLLVVLAVIGAFYLLRTFVSPAVSRGVARVAAPAPVVRTEEQPKPLTITTKASMKKVAAKVQSGMPDNAPGFGSPTWYLKSKTPTAAGGIRLAYGWGTKDSGEDIIVDIMIEAVKAGSRVTQDVIYWKETSSRKSGAERMEVFRQHLIDVVRQLDPAAQPV